jgi:putative sterol carrier protein
MKAFTKKYVESGIPVEVGLGSTFDKIIQFEVSGDAKPDFYLVIKGGTKMSIFEGKHEKSNITISSDKDTMAEVSDGKLTIMAAYMRGDIEVRGEHSDTELMKLVQVIFPTTK